MLMDEFTSLIGAFDLAHYLLFLKWVDRQRTEFSMENLEKKKDVAMKKVIDDHREKRGAQGQDRDLIDVLISATDNNAVRSEDLGKVQQELDKNVGRERTMEESGVLKLKYLAQAIVKETPWPSRVQGGLQCRRKSYSHRNTTVSECVGNSPGPSCVGAPHGICSKTFSQRWQRNRCERAEFRIDSVWFREKNVPGHAFGFECGHIYIGVAASEVRMVCSTGH